MACVCRDGVAQGNGLEQLSYLVFVAAWPASCVRVRLVQKRMLAPWRRRPKSRPRGCSHQGLRTHTAACLFTCSRNPHYLAMTFTQNNVLQSATSFVGRGPNTRSSVDGDGLGGSPPASAINIAAMLAIGRATSPAIGCTYPG